MARGSLHSFEFNFSRVGYDGVWFSAGSAPLTPVLSVCIFLVIFSASLFFCPLFTEVVSTERFFFYSVINVFSNVAKYNTSHKIYLSKSKITD